MTRLILFYYFVYNLSVMYYMVMLLDEFEHNVRNTCFGLAVFCNGKQVSGSVLPAAVISLYCTYLCYSALASEPRDYECNGLHKHSKAVSTGTLTLGLCTTVLSVVYSAVRAGSSTTLLSPPSSPRAGKSCHRV